MLFFKEQYLIRRRSCTLAKNRAHLAVVLLHVINASFSIPEVQVKGQTQTTRSWQYQRLTFLDVSGLYGPTWGGNYMLHLILNSAYRDQEARVTCEYRSGLIMIAHPGTLNDCM